MENLTLLNANKPEKVMEIINEIPSEIEGRISVAKGEMSTYADKVVESERRRALDVETEFNKRLAAQEGFGGSLDAHDFGVAVPTQQALTDYALSQIPSISNPLDIWNRTRIHNLFDNGEWQLTNTQNTAPPIFEWVFIGAGKEAATQFSKDTTTTNVSYVAVHKHDKTFAATGITAVNIAFDKTVKQGFISGINFVSGSTPPILTFTNTSEYPLKLISGTETEEFFPSANTTVNIAAYCDGINLYCYISEV